MSKFQNEYVEYYWNIFLHGGADHDDGRVLTFNVTPEERMRFAPALKGRRKVRIVQDDVTGYVHEL